MKDRSNTNERADRHLDDVELQLLVSHNETMVRRQNHDSPIEHLRQCPLCRDRERAMRLSFGRLFGSFLDSLQLKEEAFEALKTAHACETATPGSPKNVENLVSAGLESVASTISWIYSATSANHEQSDSGRDEGERKQSNSQKGGLYALSGREHEDKELAARWVAENLPLASNSGLFFDAGSQCLEAWKGLAQRIEKERVEHLSVLTGNLKVLQSWAENFANAQLHVTNIQIAGERFDGPHFAFYGHTARDQLLSQNFRPSVVFIGAAGIEFDRGSIWLGYNAGDQERDAKTLLFQCLTKARVILATPSKIGNAGGVALNVLSIEQLDSRAPIYLVSTEPEPGSPFKEQYAQAEREMRSVGIQKAFTEKGITFHWVAIDRQSKDKLLFRHETYPKTEEPRI